MTKSAVVDNASGKSVDSEIRTSTGMFFAKGADEIITRIEKRVAQVTMIPSGGPVLARGCIQGVQCRLWELCAVTANLCKFVHTAHPCVARALAGTLLSVSHHAL